jgi:hypothetical protein
MNFEQEPEYQYSRVVTAQQPYQQPTVITAQQPYQQPTVITAQQPYQERPYQQQQQAYQHQPIPTYEYNPNDGVPMYAQHPETQDTDTYTNEEQLQQKIIIQRAKYIPIFSIAALLFLVVAFSLSWVLFHRDSSSFLL